MVSRSSVGSARRPPPGAGTQLVADELDGAEAAVLVGQEGDGREQEAQDDALAVACRGPGRVGAQDLDVAPGRDVGLDDGARPPGEGERPVEFGRIDDHVGVGELAELEQLRVREARLGWPAAADDDDLGDLAAGEHGEGVVGGVGGRELGRREHEHAGDIERDVAVADDHRAAGGTAAGGGGQEVELEVAVVGMAVVPADELGGGVRAGEVFAGDAERAIRGRTGRVDDRVVVGQQVLAGHMLAERDVAEVAEAGVFGGLLVHAGDRLDLGVVGCDAGADQAPRGGKPLQHVDLEVSVGVLQEVPGGVEAGGARADDCDADGELVGHRPGWRSGVSCGWRRGWARPDSNGRPPRCKRGALAN